MSSTVAAQASINFYDSEDGAVVEAVLSRQVIDETVRSVPGGDGGIRL